MTFGQPMWFWAMAILPVLLVFFVRNERRRGRLLRQLVAARLQDRLAGTVSVGRRRFRFALLLLGLAGVIAALAQPRLGYTYEQSKRHGHDVIIAIDCSRSMLATDLPPSRLGRSKMAAQDLIGQLKGDRVGLIAFAGSAFLQAPLTIDYAAVLNSLAELDTTIIPRGGTNIAAAIKQAGDAFGKGESENRVLVIFTDGEELYADAMVAAEDQKGKMRIFTVGLGSAEGSLIPVPGKNGGTEFVKDENGQIVKSKLDEDRLTKIAELTGGFYLHLENGPAEMKQIVSAGLGQMKEQEIDARMSRRPIERYQWPLAAGLALLISSTLIGERKNPARRKARAMVVAALAALCFVSPAFGAKNSGVEAYDRQDYKGAANEFDRQLKRMPNSEELHFNLGATAYKSGDMNKALDSFSKAVTTADPRLRSAAEYNIGNTLFQRGVGAKEKDAKIREWKDAIQHYEQAMKVAPQNKDAEYNRDVVQRMLEALEQPPEQQQQQQEQKSQEKKDEEKKEQDQQQQEQKGDKGQEQKKDQQSQDSKGQQQQQDKSQGGQDGKEQEPKDQQGKGEQSKMEQNKDEQGKEQEKNKQEKSEKGDEKKDAKDEPGQGAEGSSPKDGKPQPPPKMPERELAGDIQAQNGQQPQPTPQEEAAAEAKAAEEGKMTEAQARTLLESLKNEDQRVPLLRPGEKRAPRPLRDW